MNNIENDLSAPMCCGCGMCSAICPTDAIKVEISKNGTYYPALDAKLCVNCGKCPRVCPGINMDWNTLNCQVFGKKPEDHAIGNFISIHKGYSSEHDLRQSASSGGVATAMLEFLLSEGQIDAALVTRLTYGGQVRAEPFWATTKEEIRQGKGSKYCPVSLDSVIRELRDSDRRVAIVCLPCHGIALRKAMALDPKLQRNIKFVFSLFCNQTPSYRALDRFLGESNMTQKDVAYFQWRGDGWPGTTKVVSNRGIEKSYFFPKVWRLIFGSGNYTPWACYCCYDFFGEFSDISFGDAWLPETKEDRIGTNVFIVRTAKARDVVERMTAKRLLCVEALDTQGLKDAFAPNVAKKKAGYKAHRLFVPGCPSIREAGSFRLGPRSYWRELKAALRILKGSLR